MPAGQGRFVERHVAVVADATIADIRAADALEGFADIVGPERVGDVNLAGRRPEAFIDFGEQFALEEAGERQRVGRGNGAALPVEKLIHLEDVHVPPGEAFTVGEVH